MNDHIKNKKIAIIGSGMSGLSVARQVAKRNDVTIFDKSRGIGGRMATRRVDDYHFDHGAQFFTAKSDEFKALLKHAKDQNIIEEWHADFAEITGNKITKKWQFNSDHAHYVSKPQMNSLCKFMGKDLNIVLSKQIIAIDFVDQKWSLKTKDDEIFDDFDYLILAIPSHQALNLIPKDFKYLDMLSRSTMSGCFTLMLGFKENMPMEFDAALVKESNISWISVNSSKPGRPKDFALVVNSSNQWADENIEEDLDVVKEKMMRSLQEIVTFDVNNAHYHNIHRWRYANADLRQGDKSVFDPNLNLGLCGDWLISGRVEHAFLSGLDLYQNINNER